MDVVTKVEVRGKVKGGCGRKSSSSGKEMRACPQADLRLSVLDLHVSALAALSSGVLHVGGPQREVVPQQLHDQGAVLVGLLAQGVELGDGLVERLQEGQEKRGKGDQGGQECGCDLKLLRCEADAIQRLPASPSLALLAHSKPPTRARCS